jgi:hypothetical protein
MNFDPSLMLYTNNSKWIIDLNVKHNTVKLLKKYEKLYENLQLSKEFTD